MSRSMRWLLGLTVVAVVTIYASFAPVPPSPDPFAHGGWKVESVMLLDPATTTTYALAEPFRVIRDGNVTVTRPLDTRADRVIRVDLTIEGESVILYTRLRE